MADTQEELVGLDLVLRRPNAVGLRAVRLGGLALAIWIVTLSLADFGLRESATRWWLVLALSAGLIATTITVLTVRVITSRIVLSRQSVAVSSLAGRRSVGWSTVGGVQAERPYFGLLGDMPVLTLTDQRVLSVDALARRNDPAAVDKDVVRIRTYLGLPGLPPLAPVAPAPAPVGPSPAGRLRVSWGRLDVLPNERGPAARVLTVRVLIPLIGLGGALVAVLLIVPPGPVHLVAAPLVLLFAVAVCAVLNVLVGLGGELTPAAYRNRSLLYPVDVGWPGTTVDVVPAVNAWGTLRMAHLQLVPGALPGPPSGPPVDLWETARRRNEAEALARVMSTY
ncbi:MAG: hypothetical protein ABJA87_10115 [bacterium]